MPCFFVQFYVHASVAFEEKKEVKKRDEIQ